MAAKVELGEFRAVVQELRDGQAALEKKIELFIGDSKALMTGELEKKKEELEAKMKKVDDNVDKIKNAMKTQTDGNLARKETNDRHEDQLKEQEEQLKELDQKLEAWALEWPQGGAQAGDAGGNRSSDATRRPRVRLPEVPKLGLKVPTDKNYKDWVIDPDLQLGTYWTGIEELFKKAGMSKVQITEEMHDKWVSELNLITPGCNPEDWKFKFVSRYLYSVLGANCYRTGQEGCAANPQQQRHGLFVCD